MFRLSALYIMDNRGDTQSKFSGIEPELCAVRSMLLTARADVRIVGFCVSFNVLRSLYDTPVEGSAHRMSCNTVQHSKTRPHFTPRAGFEPWVPLSEYFLNRAATMMGARFNIL